MSAATYHPRRLWSWPGRRSGVSSAGSSFLLGHPAERFHVGDNVGMPAEPGIGGGSDTTHPGGEGGGIEATHRKYVFPAVRLF